MKKSIFRVLTLSLVLGGVGLISSCKDYDENLRTEFNSQIANLDVTLNEKIDQQIGNLNDKLKALEAQLAAIKQCNCGVDKPWTSDLATAVENALNQVDQKLAGKTDEAQVRKIIAEILGQELSGYYTKDQVEALIDSKIKAIDFKECECDLNALKEVIKKEVAEMIKTAITTTVTEDYIKNLVDDDYANKAAFEALKKKVDEMVLVACTCTDLTETINKLKSDLAAAEKTIVEHGENIEELYKLYKDLNANYVSLDNRVTEIEKNAKAALDAAKAAQGKAEEALNQANAAMDKANEVMEALKNLPEGTTDPALAARVILLEKWTEKWEPVLKSWEPEIAKISQVENKVNALSKELSESVAALEKAIDDKFLEAYDHADEAWQKAVENADKIEDLQGLYDALDKDLEATIERVAANEEAIEDLTERVTTNEEAIDSLKKVLGMAQYDLVLLHRELADLKYQHDIDLAQLKKDCANNLIAAKNYAKSYTDSQIKNLKTSEIDPLKAHVAELENWRNNTVDPQLEQLNNDLSDLETRVSGLESTVSTLQGEVDKLVDQVSDILNKMVTGITVNAIKNPVFGMLNMPTNIKTNVLVAYYGENSNGNITFPGQSTTGYVYSDEAFTADEWNLISGTIKEKAKVKAGETLLEDDDANAGVVYLTVNPNTTDFDGAQLKLVNSQGKESGMELSPLAKSDEVLKLGYTRAADNGFYEMKVKVTDPDAVQKVDIEAGRFKDILSDIKNYKDGFDLANTIDAVYDLFNEVLDANALEATWTETDGTEHKVYSDYNIAATAVHPLSYNFMADKKIHSIPGFDRVNKFIDKAFNKVLNQLQKEIGKAFAKVVDKFPAMPTVKKFDLDPTSVDYQNAIACFDVTLDNVTVKYDEGEFTIKDNLEIVDNTNAVVGKLPAGNKIKVENGKMIIHIEMDLRDQFGDFYEEVASNVNDLIDALDKFSKDVQSAIDAMNDISDSITSIGNDLGNRLHSLLNKVEKKLVNLMNSVLTYLQPVLMYSEGTDLHVMNAPVSYANLVGSTSITLYPWSYTAETVSAAYKKHIAVVNVIKTSDPSVSAQNGDATCKSYLDAVNNLDNMNSAIAGSIHEIEVSGLQSGYTYQFAYSAMDYSGYVVTKRSAIRVK